MYLTMKGIQNNMKRLKIGLIMILGMIALGLCVVLVYGISAGNAFRHAPGVAGDGNFDRYYADMQCVLDEEIPLDGIDSILLLYDMNNNDVIFSENEGSHLIIKEYVNYDVDDSEISTVNQNGSELEIKGKKRKSSYINLDFNFFAYHSHSGRFGYTQVWLPASYKGSLKTQTASGDILAEMDIAIDGNCTLSSTSGEMSLGSISAKQAEISSVSGDQMMEAIQAEQVDIASTSGSIMADTIQTDVEENNIVNIATTSGDIQLTRLLAKEISISTLSGYLNAEDITGTAGISSSSGDIMIAKLEGAAVASATSGDIQINAGSGTREVSTSSGDILLEGVSGNFNAATTSGEVSIHAQEGAGKIETSSGDVRLDLPVLTGDLDISTTSGEVSIRLAKDSSFAFAADTASGDIDTFFDDSLTYSKRRDSAKGNIGTGTQGYKVEIETSSGDVCIESQ